MKRYQGVVNGSVQDVGFRYFTKKKAVEYGLTGWVRNRSDGTVEFEVQGNEVNLKAFFIKLYDVQYPAKVLAIKLQEYNVDENSDHFKILSSDFL